MLLWEVVDVIDRRPTHNLNAFNCCSYPPLSIKANLRLVLEPLRDGDHYWDHTAYCARLLTFQMKHDPITTQRHVRGRSIIYMLLLLFIVIVYFML